MAANGETYVVYGDLKLWNCLTPASGFRQEAVMDESGTDLLYYKFTIRVVGWVTNITGVNSIQATIGSSPNLGTTSAGTRQAGMQYTIAPRKHFEYHTGAIVDGSGTITDQGATLIKCDPFTQPSQVNNPSGYDLNNGPKCTQFSITQVTSDSLFRVEAEFEICILQCGPSQSSPNTTGILNNRWSIEDVVDLNRFTTRTQTGQMRLMSSVINPNTFRNAVTPGLQAGFSRQSVSIGVTPDGLTLIYTITDREIAYSAPAPATSWSFEHTETSSRDGGIAKFGEVRVVLRGDRNVDHKKLITVAASICEAKLTAGAAANACYIMSVEISDRYGDDENSISMTVRGQRFPEGDSLLGLPTELLGEPLTGADLAKTVQNYDSRLSRGTRQGDKIELAGPISAAQALSSYLQTPCDGNHTVTGGIAIKGESPSQTSTTQVSLTLVQPQNIPDDRSNKYFNNSANQAIYTYYQMQTSYETTGMRAHCPLAVFAGSSGITGNQASSAVVNLANRMSKRRVRLKAERVGAWPNVPSMPDTYTDVNQITYTLLDTTDLPLQPDYTPDGKQIYTLSREYVYAMSRAPNANDIMTVGVNPFDLSKPVIKEYDNGQQESSYPLT